MKKFLILASLMAVVCTASAQTSPPKPQRAKSVGQR